MKYKILYTFTKNDISMSGYYNSEEFNLQSDAYNSMAHFLSFIGDKKCAWVILNAHYSAKNLSYLVTADFYKDAKISAEIMEF